MFRDYRYILTIAEEKSISKAAEKLFLSQPSLSLALTKIEENLGVKLFDRSSKGMRLTKYGEVYVDAAQHILGINDTMLSAFKDMKENGAGHIRLGINPRLGSFLLPAILPRIKTLYPKMDIEVIEGTSSNLTEQLETFGVDLALLNHRIEARHITCEAFATDSFLICLSPNNSLRTLAYFKEDKFRPYLDLKKTENLSYVLTKPGQSTREKVNQIFLNCGIQPQVALLTQNILTAAQICSTTNYVTLIPESYTHMISPAYPIELFRIDESLDPFWYISAAYNNEILLTDSSRKLISVAKECCNDLFS